MSSKKRNLVVSTSALAAVLAISSFGLLASRNTAAKEDIEYIKNTQSTTKTNKKTKTNEDIEANFEYQFTRNGGTSSIVVATIDGVDHVFGWGDNTLGQLGKGDESYTSSDFTDRATRLSYLTDIWTYQTGKADTTKYPNSIKSLPTPEDLNVDGGDAGIQGDVVDVIMGEATTYVVIRNKDTNLLEIWATGSNIYGQLGNGHGKNWLDDSASEVYDEGSGDMYSDGFGYRAGWEKISFIGEDGEEVKFKELLAMSSYKTTTISGIDEKGQNRVFSWGWNGSGIGGTGTYGTDSFYYADADSMKQIHYINTDVVDSPKEITNNFLLPEVIGGEIEIDNGILNGKPYGINLPITQGEWGPSTSTYSDIEEQYQNTTDLIYPFKTTSLNDGGWKITNIDISKTAAYFEATHTSGERVLLQTGKTNGVTTSLFYNTGSDDWSSVPLIWYWDGMPGSYLFQEGSVYYEAENIKLKDYKATPFNLMLALNMSINGQPSRDHLINFNRTISDQGDKRHVAAPSPHTIGHTAKSKYYYDGNGVTVSELYKESEITKLDEFPIVSDVNLGYAFNAADAFTEDNDPETATSMGLKPGDEIIEVFATNDKDYPTVGALIKTKTPDGDYVYSMVGWGSNKDGILNEKNQEEVKSNNHLYSLNNKFQTTNGWNGNNTTLFLTTAQQEKDLQDNTLISGNHLPTDETDGKYSYITWDELVTQGRTLNSYNEDAEHKGWFRKQTISKDEIGEFIEIDDTKEYRIQNIIGGGTSFSFELTDGTNTYRYYFGNNEDKQISSNIDVDNIYSPVSLFISATALSDSFKLDKNTTTSDGIYFSLEVIHGGEIESFVPEFTDNVKDDSLRLYGDVNHNSKTDVNEEQLGQGEFKFDGMSSDYRSGVISYKGRGTENLANSGSTDENIKNPEYDMSEIPLDHQVEKTYSETYNFQISELYAGEAFVDLYVAVNGNTPVSVDGVLETTQTPKYSNKSENVVINETSSDYIKFTIDLMYGVPGYSGETDFTDAPTSLEAINENTVIYFEDQNGVTYSNDQTYTDSNKSVVLETTKIGDKPASGQTNDQELITGQDISFTLSGLSDNLQLSKFKFYYKGVKDATSIWDSGSSENFAYMTIFDAEQTASTRKIAELSNKFYFYETIISNTSTEFSLDIKSDVYMNGGVEELYTIVDPSDVTLTASVEVADLGGTKERVVFNSKDSAETATMTIDGSKATVKLDNLQSKKKYSNIQITVNDKAADNSIHTPNTLTATDPDYTIITDAQVVKYKGVSEYTDLTTENTVGIELQLIDNYSNNTYAKIDGLLNDPEIKATTNKGSKDLTVKYAGDNSADSPTGYTSYYYEVSGLKANETITDVSLVWPTTFELNGKENFVSEIKLSGFSATTDTGRLTPGKLHVETVSGKSDSLKISLSFEKPEGSSWDDYEVIDWDTLSVSGKIDLPNADEKDFSDLKLTSTNNSKDGNVWTAEYTYQSETIKPNTKVNITNYSIENKNGDTIERNLLDASTGIGSQAITEADAPTLNETNGIVIGDFADGNLTVTINTVSEISNEEIAKIERIEFKVTGTNKVTEEAAPEISDAIIKPTSDSNTVELTGFAANTHYDTLTYTIIDNSPKADTTGTKPVSIAIPPLDLLAEDFDQTPGEIQAVDGKATYSIDVSKSTEKENIAGLDPKGGDVKLAMNDPSATGNSVNINATPIDDGMSADYALKNVLVNANYDRLAGKFVIELDGLVNGVNYSIENLKLTADGTAVNTNDSLEISTPKIVVSPQLPVDVKNINISNITMDKGDYLNSELTLTFDAGIKAFGIYEAIDTSLVAHELKDTNGNIYTATSTTFNKDTHTTSTGDSGVIETTEAFDVTLSLPTDVDVIGDSITFASVTYNGTDIAIPPYEIQTYKLFDSEVHATLYGSNVDKLTSPEDQLVLELGTPDDGKEYFGVEFTEVTINGEDYELEQVPTRSKNLYNVIGFSATDGEEIIVEGINGVESNEVLGETDFEAALEALNDGSFPWWIIILLLVLLLTIVGIVLFILWLFFRPRVEETLDNKEGEVTFTINRNADHELMETIKHRPVQIKQGRKVYIVEDTKTTSESGRIQLTLKGITNLVTVKEITFLADKEANKVATERYEAELATYNEAKEAFNARKDAAKLEEKEFTEKFELKKPSKPKLGKDIKLAGEADSMIYKEYTGGELNSLAEAEAAVKYCEREIAKEKSNIKKQNKIKKDNPEDNLKQAQANKSIADSNVELTKLDKLLVLAKEAVKQNKSSKATVEIEIS